MIRTWATSYTDLADQGNWQLAETKQLYVTQTLQNKTAVFCDFCIDVLDPAVRSPVGPAN